MKALDKDFFRNIHKAYIEREKKRKYFEDVKIKIIKDKQL